MFAADARAYNIAASDISMETEALYREVERRKQRAIDLGVPLLVMKACLDKINDFQAWSQSDGRVFIPPEITELKESEPPEEAGVRFNCGGHLYAYKYREQLVRRGSEGGDATEYEFRFFVDDSLVLECQGRCEYGFGDYDSDIGTTRSQLTSQGYRAAGVSFYKFAPENIKAFVDGEWIDEVKRLAELIEEQEKRGEKLQQEIEGAMRKQEREDQARSSSTGKRLGRNPAGGSIHIEVKPK